MINITFIYLITGIDNSSSKVYIGKTKNSREYAHKRNFGSDIKYTVIDSIDSLDRKDWEPLETKWIQHYINLGYEVVNKRKKGGGGPEFHKEETKNKISMSHYGIRRPKYIGEKISKSNTGNKKIRVKQRKDKGIPKSETHINKMSIAKLGKPSTNPKKPILQYDIQGNFIKEWDSGSKIQKELNISHGNIVKCCKGLKKQIGGFVWHYK